MVEDMKQSTDRIRVVIFGILDGIHDGHRDMFRQARDYGGELVVILGRDESALRLKNRKPQYSEEERLELLRQEQWVSRGVLGDEEPSSYQVLKQLNPDVICLGYDQQVLNDDLRKWMNREGKNIPIWVLKPYQPDVFHNSLLSPT